MVTFPCGKCAACRSNLRDSWKFRLQKEADSSLSSWFLTLTYSDETVPVNGVDKTDFQLYIKRFRKQFPDVKARYYAIGEYGGVTGRPHYHACMFLDVMEFKPENFEKNWYDGHVHVCKCSSATIGYIANYHTSKSLHNPDGKNAPFALMSRKPGIGAEWVAKYGDEIHQKDMLFTRINGSPYVIPRYIREKVFSKGELLALQERNRAILEARTRNEIDSQPGDWLERNIAYDRLQNLKYAAYAANVKHKSNNKI